MTLTMVCTSEGRGEELAVVVRPLLGELEEKVFVNSAEHVARRGPQGFAVEHAQHAVQQVVVEAFVVLG